MTEYYQSDFFDLLFQEPVQNPDCECKCFPEECYCDCTCDQCVYGDCQCKGICYGHCDCNDECAYCWTFKECDGKCKDACPPCTIKFYASKFAELPPEKQVCLGGNIKFVKINGKNQVRINCLCPDCTIKNIHYRANSRAWPYYQAKSYNDDHILSYYDEFGQEIDEDAYWRYIRILDALKVAKANEANNPYRIFGEDFVKIKKVFALAERGFRGEKEVALTKLTKMLAKYNYTVERFKSLEGIRNGY